MDSAAHVEHLESLLSEYLGEERVELWLVPSEVFFQDCIWRMPPADGARTREESTDQCKACTMHASRHNSLVLPARAGGGVRFCSGLGRRWCGLAVRIRLDQPQLLAQLGVDGLADVGIILHKLARVFAALTDALALI